MLKSVSRLVKKLKKSGRSSKSHGHMEQPEIILRDHHCISRSNIDDNALKVLRRLDRSGYRACLVGGAVRDLLLGKTPKDFDVATDATPEQVHKLFRNCRVIGRRFRLAHVFFGRQIIEVATFRASHDESKHGVMHEGGRILRDNVYGDIGEDVWRRDFTVNALYYDIADFSVIDYVGGVKDVEQKTLRLIGDPETRYREDAVRMLRAVRFAAKLDFEISDSAREPVHSVVGLLGEIPPARLYEEILKLFHCGHALRAYALLKEMKILHAIFPATASALEKDDGVFNQFLELSFSSTDERIKQGKPITPAFLFSAMLWRPVVELAARLEQKGKPVAIAMQSAISEVISQQVGLVAIPRRFSTVMRDIWLLQTRFHHRRGKRAISLFQHAKFRAAYDVLCLRAKAGEDVQDDCQWWTELQKQSPEQQEKTLKPKPRRRKPGGKQKPQDNVRDKDHGQSS